jgi:hypothetical protein
LFANEEQQCDDDENEDGIPGDVSQSASPTVMPCVAPAHDNLSTDEVIEYITFLEERNEDFLSNLPYAIKNKLAMAQ